MDTCISGTVTSAFTVFWEGIRYPMEKIRLLNVGDGKLTNLTLTKLTKYNGGKGYFTFIFREYSIPPMKPARFRAKSTTAIPQYLMNAPKRVRRNE
ncbi:hypothetical protein EVAR_17570_1 [Eumeta japonica]|uniref:Uncharacterized protein n=1 Tax=Eumeta variegata TaxID=151549 RepID=A0A4C1UBS4_EUMVA|nr:hypothetical protein EVAR_17570_1 [Eumeta japonica]